MELMDRPFYELHELNRLILVEEMARVEKEEREKLEAERKEKLKKSANRNNRQVSPPTDVKHEDQGLVIPSSDDLEDLLEEV